MIKSIIYFFRNIVFNVRVIYPFVRIYISILEPQIKRAYEIYLFSLIKNKGVKCRIHGKITIQDSQNLILGDYVNIGSGSYLNCKGGISIGDGTMISRNVLIYSSNHNTNGSLIPFDDKYICKKVTIGKSVWIGMNVTIVPGVTIGDGAIIGMGTTVSEDIPAGAVVVGAKQRIVKYRDMDTFLDLVEQEKYFGKYFLG
ncbi:MAG: acyltransferase [Sulfurovaceae bacterium]|nr:acyltransferase [Sulfurovaceae bacterium]